MEEEDGSEKKDKKDKKDSPAGNKALDKASRRKGGGKKGKRGSDEDAAGSQEEEKEEEEEEEVPFYQSYMCVLIRLKSYLCPHTALQIILMCVLLLLYK